MNLKYQNLIVTKSLTLFIALFFSASFVHAQPYYVTEYSDLSTSGTEGNRLCTFIGDYAGQNNDTNNGGIFYGQNNTFIGGKAGKANKYGKNNTYVGMNAGINATGGSNVFLGINAGGGALGSSSTYVGDRAGYFNQGGGSVFLGYRAGQYTKNGSRNVFIGDFAGHKAQGDKNVFLGSEAGYGAIGDNQLYIDNTDTDLPLIYGDFLKDELTVNGSLDIDALGNDPAILSLTATDNDGWDSAIQFKVDNTVRHLILDNTDENRLVIAPGFYQRPSDPNSQQLHVSGELLVGPANDWETPAGYRLFVKEGILAEKVKVAAHGSIDWADFVFEEDYDLNSTEKVEQFIKENKHLPNVPSVKEVNENGVDMVEMDATLLRQIEELWLHMIELKKDNEALKEEVKALKK